MLRRNYFQYDLGPGDLIKEAFIFQLANETWSAEDLSDLDSSSETPPDSANFSDPRKQKPKMCHRPKGIWELGRECSSISSVSLEISWGKVENKLISHLQAPVGSPVLSCSK